MTALVKDIIVHNRLTEFARAEFGYPVQAGARVWRGSIIVLCSDGTVIPAGATPAGAATAVAVVGLADHFQDNTNTSPVPTAFTQPRRVRARRGCFKLPFDTAPTAASVHAAVYALDDGTVTLTSSGHLQVGTLAGIDEMGAPWVETL